MKGRRRRRRRRMMRMDEYVMDGMEWNGME